MHLIQDDTRLHHSSFLACKLREPLKRFFQQIFQFYNMQKYIGNEILIIDSDRTRDTSWTLTLNQASLKYGFGGFGTIFGGLKLSTVTTIIQFQTSKNRPKSPKSIL